MKRKRHKKQKGFFRSAVVFLEVLLIVPIIMLIIANQLIRISTENYIYDDMEDLPAKRVGLVLGTSPRLKSGGTNPYFSNRMEAAAELYHYGKIQYMIVSGDNSTPYYNEPEHMHNALVELGVPSTVIFSDKAGLRTLDSVIRARDVFGQENLTIISQKFHNQRAVYIAKKKGMEVSAYNASDVPFDKNDRTRVREWFAKAMVFYDLFTNQKPASTGERIVIE